MLRVIQPAKEIPQRVFKEILSMTLNNSAEFTGRFKPGSALFSPPQAWSWIESSLVCTKIVDLDLNLQYMSKSGIRDFQIVDINDFYGIPYPLSFYPESFKEVDVQNTT